eukprot:4058412-Pleurochrysis_carterae.AAC.1
MSRRRAAVKSQRHRQNNATCTHRGGPWRAPRSRRAPLPRAPLPVPASPIPALFAPRSSRQTGRSSRAPTDRSRA